MNPADMLESKGWKQTDPKRYYARKIDRNYWRLTFTSNSGPLGNDTVRRIEAELSKYFTVRRYTFRNAPIPNIIYIDMPERKHYLFIYLVEK